MQSASCSVSMVMVIFGNAFFSCSTIILSFLIQEVSSKRRKRRGGEKTKRGNNRLYECGNCDCIPRVVCGDSFDCVENSGDVFHFFPSTFQY